MQTNRRAFLAALGTLFLGLGLRQAQAAITPTITKHPQGGKYAVPHTVSVVATSSAPLFYRWQTFSALPTPGAWINVPNDDDFSGANTANLTINTPNSLELRCIVFNSFGWAVSETAVVTTTA